jgi:NAD(P)-dependent dehydrogenase (short-subunit alcohol dehydrogenase family)
MNLNGKNAVVTSGDRGIGQAISLALTQKGMNVAVHYH